MKITNVHFVPGYSAFYFDDQHAIKSGASQDGFIYQGSAQTPGFHSVRQAGESISVMLELDNGHYAHGDCVAVQYSGAGGRDPLFRSDSYLKLLQNYVRPLLIDRDVSYFRDNAVFFDELTVNGRPLHTAIRYGLSQALLDASAIANRELKAEVLCREYNLPLVTQPIPLFGQSGDDRYSAVDKMILKQVDALPHGLINNIPDKLGHDGEKLNDYIRWLVQRIEQLRLDATYRPDLHIDVYGTIGMIFDHDPVKIADYLAQLGDTAAPFQLYIEGPIDAGGREAQIEQLAQLRRELEKRGSLVKLVADEWCNTLDDIRRFADAECCHMVQIKTPDLGSVHNSVEAVTYSKRRGVQAYMGGTCNETDVSARTCVHLAIAARPKRLLAKPGMGFDEGMTIVSNELQRSLRLLATKQPRIDTPVAELF